MYSRASSILSEFRGHVPSWLICLNLENGDADAVESLLETALLAVCGRSAYIMANTYMGNFCEIDDEIHC